MQRILLSIALIALALPLCAEEKRTGSHIKQIDRVVVTTAAGDDASVLSPTQRRQLAALPELPVESDEEGNVKEAAPHRATD